MHDFNGKKFEFSRIFDAAGIYAYFLCQYNPAHCERQTSFELCKNYEYLKSYNAMFFLPPHIEKFRSF